MNCQDVRKRLLRNSDGMAAPRRRVRIEKHLASCPACRAHRDEIVQFGAFIRSAPLEDGPSEHTMQRIMAFAAAERPQPSRLAFPAAWRPLLAVAACLALVLGILGALAIRRPLSLIPAATATSRLTEVSSLLVMLMEHDEAAAEAHTAAVKGDMKGFARQLLIIEGLDPDGTELETVDATIPEESQPTTLQWRSTSGRPSGRCV